MKKLVIVLFIIILFLTGCVSYDDVKEMKADWQYKYDELEEEWSSKYYNLEEEYNSACSKIEDLESFIYGIDELSLDLNQYFESHAISFDEAHLIYDQIRSEFVDYYSEK